MRQLTKEETAKVFAMYCPCKTSGSIELSYENVFYAVNTGLKILLTPLSAITDEHKNGIAAMYGGEWCKIDDGFVQIIDTEGMVKKWLILSEDLPSMLFQYLIQQCYAVPLFFGIDHPCNGKTAIELGIAIENELHTHMKSKKDILKAWYPDGKIRLMDGQELNTFIERKIYRAMDEYAKEVSQYNDEVMRENIANALYATKRFLTFEASELASHIMDYIKEHNKV